MDAFDYHDVRQAGAAGDGRTDDAPTIQATLDKGGVIFIPPGAYLIGRTLRIGSGTRLTVHPQAVLRLADGAGVDQHSHLLTNSDPQGGNADIEISGGIWDGNNPGNPRQGDLINPGSYTGVMLQFRNVRNLTLSGLTLRNAETYYVAMTQIQNFIIEHIRFESTSPRPNNDGIHLGGYCEDGIIRHLSGHGRCVPNDDMVAMNADDAIERIECQNMLRGPIRRVVVHDLHADQCHSFVRLLSTDAPIEDIDVSGIRGGCTESVLNMDGARHCRVQVFDAADPAYADGAGFCRRIRLSDIVAHKAGSSVGPLVRLFQRCDDLEIRSLRRDLSADLTDEAPTIDARYIPGHRLVVEGLDAAQAETVTGTDVVRTVVPQAGVGERSSVVVGCELDRDDAFCLPDGGFGRLMLSGPVEVFGDGS
jgi:hypothetical protein